MLMFDPLFWVFVGPAFLLAVWAQIRVSAAFAKYSRVPARSGYSGARAAEAILRHAGVDVAVEPVAGRLTDHYDPQRHVLRLSEQVYAGRSIAALGIAAHEAGHALQHAAGYRPMALRGAIVPIASLGSKAAMPLFFFGLILGGARGVPLGGLLMTIGIVVFAAVVVFQVITLPVEINASRRAIAVLGSSGIVDEQELPGAKAVLTAAALTYVAAALQGILTLLYLVSRRRN
jgi:Zn-dependent membrane protease YugP